MLNIDRSELRILYNKTGLHAMATVLHFMIQSAFSMYSFFSTSSLFFSNPLFHTSIYFL